MLILGVETSCDETAIALVEDGARCLASVIASQDELHVEFGGVVPEIASRAHVERFIPTLQAALRDSGAALADIDAVAVGNRPGLIGSLLVGVPAAQAIAWALGAPIVGVDHVRAHLAAPALDAAPIDYPALGLVVSGGHTTLFSCQSPIELTAISRTIDDAVGEAYDKVASMLGLAYPGGPKLDALAQRGDATAHDFPIASLADSPLDFSFSGLKTALLYAIRGKPRRDEQGRTRFPREASDLTHKERADLAASFQRAAVAQLIDRVERALPRCARGAAGRSPLPLGEGGEQREPGEGSSQRAAGTCEAQRFLRASLSPNPSPTGRGESAPSPYRSLIVGGGVSANSLLRSELARVAEVHSVALRLAPIRHCLDNAAMIAALGYHKLRAGLVDDLSLTASATSSD